MENYWRVRIIALAIGFCWLSAMLLRYEAIDLKMPPEPAAGFIVALGWFLLTGLIFILFGYGLTSSNVPGGIARKIAITSFIAMFFYLVMTIYVGIGLAGDAGERLLAGLTTIYTGSALLPLDYYTKALRRWKYIAYVALVGLGIWRIVRCFL